MRTILHCDLNNFFASVEIFDNPELSKYPVAVCGSVEERSGIVLAKNMLAKSFGVKTAEPIWQAKQKCPKLVTVSPHYDRYMHFSKLTREIYCNYTDTVESFGIDEAWLDVTHSRLLFGTGEEIAHKIRNDIKNNLGITASVGVSFNKVFAKLGSDLKKPDAVTVISEDNFKRKIFHLPASDMLWVGRATNERLSRYYIKTIGDIANARPEFLTKILGINGEMLWRNANGLDNSPVQNIDFTPEIKSVGNSTTAIYDLETEKDIKNVFLSLSLSVSKRLRKDNLEAGGVQISVKDSNLITHEYQCNLDNPSRSQRVIYETALKLFSKSFCKSGIRALGVRAIKVIPDDSNVQLSMLYDYSFSKKMESLESTFDKINGRYGEFTVRPASLLNLSCIKEGLNPQGFSRKA